MNDKWLVRWVGGGGESWCGNAYLAPRHGGESVWGRELEHAHRFESRGDAERWVQARHVYYEEPLTSYSIITEAEWTAQLLAGAT